MNSKNEGKILLTFLKISCLMLTVLTIFLLFTSCHQPLFQQQNWQLVASGFSFPEGPAWDGDGNLLVSNCRGNWIAKISAQRVDTLLLASDTTFSQTNGLAVTSDGSIFACDFGAGAIIKIAPAGKVEAVIADYLGQRFNRPNDLIVLDNNSFYFTDPQSYGADKTDGRLFFYRAPEQEPTLVADSLAFPNGLGISPRDGRLYVCESAKNLISRFDIAADGRLIHKQTFIRLPGGDPDGIEFDSRGNLFVAHFGSGTVYVISPAGQIMEQRKTPGKKPSNLEFGDRDRKTLYLTEDETNAVYKIRVKNPGFHYDTP